MVVLAAFCAITALFFAPTLPHLATALLGPPEDNLNDFWSNWYAVGPRENFFETTLVRWPEGTTLLFHTFAYPVLFVLVPLTRLFGTARETLVLMQNVALLASFPLAGLGGYYLVRHFVAHRLAAFAGGFVYAFNPAHLAQAMHHQGVAQTEFFPFFVLCWIVCLHRHSYRLLAVAVGLCALNALCSWYNLFYAGFFVVFYGVFRMVRDDKLPKGWSLTAPALLLVGIGLALSPLIVPMLMAPGAVRIDPFGNDRFVADLAGFILFPPYHSLSAIAAPLFRHLSGNAWEATVYLGLANLGLLTWLLIKRAWDEPTAFALTGMATFAVLAMGNTLHVFGIGLETVHLPNLVLSHLPLLDIMRTPARIMVLVYLFLAVGVGHALATALHGPRGIGTNILIAATVLAIAADFYPTGLETTDAACPQILHAITQDRDRNFGVLNLPVGYAEANVALFQQTCHGRPVVQGNPARVLTPALIDTLDTTSAAAQKAQLTRARVKYILIDASMPWSDASGPKDFYRTTYRRVVATPRWTVLQVY